MDKFKRYNLIELLSIWNYLEAMKNKEVDNKLQIIHDSKKYNKLLNTQIRINNLIENILNEDQ